MISDEAARRTVFQRRICHGVHLLAYVSVIIGQKLPGFGSACCSHTLMQGKTICDLSVGQSASTAKTISEADVYLFAGITGDLNPAHINQTYGQATRFGGRIAHGMLSAGLISAVIGIQLPGPGTIYLGQDLKFLAPVRIGDTVTAVRGGIFSMLAGFIGMRIATSSNARTAQAAVFHGIHRLFRGCSFL